MKVVYILSNRQLKELLVRGQAVRIALPAPPIEIDNAADWARSVLPPDLRDLIQSADEQEVRVSPASSSDGLAGVLGGITDSAIWTVAIAVVVVRLSKQPAGRAVEPIQWPADVVLDGKRMFPPLKRES